MASEGSVCTVRRFVAALRASPVVEAVRQVVDRGYSVSWISQRLVVSAHRRYKWVKAVKPNT